MATIIIILSVVSAILGGIITLKIFKDAGKEAKLDKISTVVKTGIDALVDRMPDGLTATEIGEIVTALVKSAKEQF